MREADIHKHQSQYWQELKQLKFEVLYLDLYYQRTEKINRNIDIFLALVSSGSIGAWAVWQDLTLIWTVLIAASQIISVVKHFLPYRRRQTNLNRHIWSLQQIFSNAEQNWYSVIEGELEDKEIHNLTTKYRKEKNGLSLTYIDPPLPHNKRLQERAEIEADKYFKNHY